MNINFFLIGQLIDLHQLIILLLLVRLAFLHLPVGRLHTLFIDQQTVWCFCDTSHVKPTDESKVSVKQYTHDTFMLTYPVAPGQHWKFWGRLYSGKRGSDVMEQY